MSEPRPKPRWNARASSAMRRVRISVAGALLIAIVAGMLLAPPAQRSSSAQAGFDFDRGNAALEVITPLGLPAVFELSPTANDPSLVLRVTTMVDAAYFDAIAPYHPTAVGVHSRLGRRPPEERTQRNKNIAMLYAAHRVGLSLFPHRAAEWRKALSDLGLDPDDDQENTTTPIGIGNMAGNAVVAAREHDGMNQLGDEGGRAYNRRPYADYTGYKPVNTAYKLHDPSRWQPLVVSDRTGTFRVQEFRTPQLSEVRPYSFDDPGEFRLPPPAKSDPRRDPAGYKAQADQVLAVSAGLTDEQKVTAELFDNKIRSIAASTIFTAQSRQYDLNRFVEFLFLNSVAEWDATIAAWSEKRRHDAVRPFSAIRYLYGDRKITAWGGPGKGTVSDITGNEWRSYLNTGDHPEYPSGSAAICEAHAQASRRYLGSDDLGWSVPVGKGSSIIEPGVTPANDITLRFDTWTRFSEVCAQSRLWGGVHFKPAIDVGRMMGYGVGDRAYEFVKAHIEGTAQ